MSSVEGTEDEKLVMVAIAKCLTDWPALQVRELAWFFADPCGRVAGICTEGCVLKGV
jgi:hypothetical protein